MEGKIEIQKASISHLDELAILFARYREFYKGQLEAESSRAFIKDRLEQKDSTIFVAQLEDNDASNLVGFTQIYPTFSSISAQRSLILNDLYVDPKARRKGVAKKLMDAASDYAKSVAATGLSLSTQKENLSAQTLYESIGYQQDHDFFHYFLSVKS